MLKGGGDKRYKIRLKAKDNEKSPEQIKLQLKKEMNQTDIKVGIKTFKTLRDGRIIIERRSEEEINSLSSAISTKCGEQLEIIKHQLRKPRIIIYTKADRKVRFPYLLKINSNIYFQNQIHNMKA